MFGYTKVYVVTMATLDPMQERGAALSQGLICNKRVHLGLSEVAFIFIEADPHVGGSLYEGFHLQKQLNLSIGSYSRATIIPYGSKFS